MAEQFDDPSADVDAWTDDGASTDSDAEDHTSRGRLVWRVVQRGLVMVVGIAIATALLAWAFDDLDLALVLQCTVQVDLVKPQAYRQVGEAAVFDG